NNNNKYPSILDLYTNISTSYGELDRINSDLYFHIDVMEGDAESMIKEEQPIPEATATSVPRTNPSPTATPVPTDTTVPVVVPEPDVKATTSGFGFTPKYKLEQLPVISSERIETVFYPGPTVAEGMMPDEYISNSIGLSKDATARQLWSVIEGYNNAALYGDPETGILQEIEKLNKVEQGCIGPVCSSSLGSFNRKWFTDEDGAKATFKIRLFEGGFEDIPEDQIYYYGSGETYDIAKQKAKRGQRDYRIVGSSRGEIVIINVGGRDWIWEEGAEYPMPLLGNDTLFPLGVNAQLFDSERRPEFLAQNILDALGILEQQQMASFWATGALSSASSISNYVRPTGLILIDGGRDKTYLLVESFYVESKAFEYKGTYLVEPGDIAAPMRDYYVNLGDRNLSIAVVLDDHLVYLGTDRPLDDTTHLFSKLNALVTGGFIGYKLGPTAISTFGGGMLDAAGAESVRQAVGQLLMVPAKTAFATGKKALVEFFPISLTSETFALNPNFTFLVVAVGVEMTVESLDGILKSLHSKNLPSNLPTYIIFQ
ncbi:MAG: hypothetical protein ISS45_13515, partial [Candidatus Omnitrophica bacterium]|nr:hypothetical protein [Candidatus Omnitrophota bacterium]